MKAAEQAEKDAREAEQAYLDSTGGGDGYPFVHESQAVRHIKIKTDWDEGKSHIDSLSITKKRCKNSPYAAESGAKRYAYFSPSKSGTGTAPAPPSRMFPAPSS